MVQLFLKKAAEKMEKQVSEKAPEMRRLLPGLSIKVEGLKGPVADGEFSKCREFGREIVIKLNQALGDENWTELKKP
ncbi:MAG: hypothetical protein QXR97_00800 [Thermoproteota archaeon]